MVDLFGADRGNISLPPRLQSPEVLDGQPDDLKQVMILNMQKALYQVRITDIEKRIERLQSRNTELEESCATEELLYSQTDVETADKIAQLNRQVFGEMEKVTDYKKRLQTAQKLMEEEKRAHLDKVEAANQKYAKTRLAIISEIKVLNAKINTLEEYKVSKTDLRNKLIAGNDIIAQRDEEAKQRCEQIERKSKIGREKLKKEMYARLLELAETFQMEVATCVAKPIHRLMRENIFLENELIDIVRESLPKKENIKQKKLEDTSTMNETVASKKLTVENLITIKIQGYLLAAVKEQHTRSKDCVEKLKQSDYEKEIKSAEDTYRYAKIQVDKVLEHVSRLERGLHRQQTQLGFINHLQDRSQTELQRCIDVLYDAKYAVACALKMTCTGKDILEMEDKQLMSYLLDILSKGDIEKWKNRTPSLATVPPPEQAYQIGDLGFEPPHIEVRGRRKTSIQKKPSKLSTFKILAALGVRLSRLGSVSSQIKPWELNITDVAKESEDLTNERPDESSMELSLSPSSQDEDPGQKLAYSEAVDEKHVTDDEAKTEAEVEAEEKMTEDEPTNHDEVDNNETITEKNENDESLIPLTEINKLSSREDYMKE